MSAKVEQLKKQNDDMYSNLDKNGVVFERHNPVENSSEEELVKFYQAEKKELIDALKEFRSKQPKAPPQKKEPQPQVKKEVKKEVKKKEAENNEDDENDVPVEKKPLYETFNNMEELKRAFCNKDMETFTKLCKEQHYLFFEASYNYDSDMNGKPDFAAKNLIAGFKRNLEDQRKYFFNCYRCYMKGEQTYVYYSLWIVNTDANLKDVTDGCSEDFTFKKVDDVDDFIKKFENSTEENLLTEAYLH